MLFMKKYLLLMNCFERENIIANLITERIKEEEQESSTWILYYDRGIDLVKIIEFNPDVVMTYPPTFMELVNILAIIKSICKSIVVEYPTEGYITDDESDDENAFGLYDFPEHLIDVWGTWGPKYKERLERYLKNRMKKCPPVLAMGYPLWEYDTINRLIVSDNKYREVLTDSHFSKVILVLSGFHEAYKTRNDWIQSIDAYNCNAESTEVKKSIDRLIAIGIKEAEVRDCYYDTIKRIAEHFREYLFVIKLHPKEQSLIEQGHSLKLDEFEGLDNVRILSDNVFFCSLYKSINGLIHYGSTVALEAYAYDVPGICIFCGATSTDEHRFGHKTVGRPYYKDELDKIIPELEDKLAFVRHDDAIDKHIYDYFNFKKGVIYEPSKLIAECLINSAIVDNAPPKGLFRYIFWGSRLEYIYCIRLFFQAHFKSSIGLFAFMIKRKAYWIFRRGRQ